MAYLRIQTGIFDPSLIGDKPKWYCRYLTPIQFKTYEEKSTLAAAIQFHQNFESTSRAKSSTKTGISSTGGDEAGSPTDESVESDLDENNQFSSQSSLTDDKLSTREKIQLGDTINLY